MSNTEKQTEYRERMYAAGYKQARIWIPREPLGKSVKMERRLFEQNLEALTAGWSKARLSKFFCEVLSLVEKSNEAKLLKESKKKK